MTVSTNGLMMTDPAGAVIDFPLSVNRRWAALDLDELRDMLVDVGLPGELIVTYQDKTGRRRYVERMRVHRGAA